MGKITSRLGRLLQIFLIGIIGFSPINIQTSSSNGIFYVSVYGNDNFDCLTPITACRNIQTAINKSSASITVINIAAGTYFENITATLLNLKISGDNSLSTIIDGGSAGKVINSAFSTLEISGVTITHGNSDQGAGLTAQDSDITLSDSRIIDNSTSGVGGGIFVTTGSLTIVSCTFTGNNAYWGGAINSDRSTILIRDSSFTEIHADRGSGVNQSFGTLNIDNSTFSGNISNEGAIYLGEGKTFITDSLVENNEKGGVIVNITNATSEATITHSTIRGNRGAYSGGGIYQVQETGKLTIKNSMISGNQSLITGGGVYIENGSISGSTIFGNSATYGGGIGSGTGSERSVLIEDSIIFGNIAEYWGGGVSGASKIDNCTIYGNKASEYGGGVHGYPYAVRGSWIVSNSDIFNNNAGISGGGIYGSYRGVVTGSRISGNTISSGNGSSGVFGESLTLIGNVVTNNSGGVGTNPAAIMSPNPSDAHMNCISGNGVGLAGSGLFDATGNWWGDPSGPYHWNYNPSGKGDEISGTDDFKPFLSQPPFNCNLRPPYSGDPLLTPGISDLKILDIEVSQVILRNPNYLISDKPAMVRVWVSATGQVPVPYVTAKLFIQNANGETKEFQPSDPAYILADTIPDPYDLRQTLNFFPDPEWLQGTLVMWAEVDPFHIIDEIDETNNIGPETTKQFYFQPADTLNILYVPIHYDPNSSICAPSSADPDPVRIAYGHLWALNVIPTASIDYHALQRQLDWNLPLKKKDSATGLCKNDDDAIVLLDKELNNISLFSRLLSWGTIDYVYGWLPNGSIDGGHSSPDWEDYPGNGITAYGDDNSILGSEIFAHEISHLLDLRHTRISNLQKWTCEDPDWPYSQQHPEKYKWPYMTAGIQEYGFDYVERNIIKPAGTYDLMSYCWLDSITPVWVSPFTYESLYTGKLQLQPVKDFPDENASSQIYFLASGLLHSDNTANLDPTWIISSNDGLESQTVGTQYCLEAQSSSGSVLVKKCFDRSFKDYETGNETSVASFNLALPYDDQTARVLLTKDGLELERREKSPNAPQVSIISPNGGESWAVGDQKTIAWSANDLDGDTLYFNVFYTPDSINWVPLGINLTENMLTVNVNMMTGGNQAKIMVMVTDGMNTGSDLSNNSFIVEMKEPDAYIIAPVDQASILANKPVLLKGYAFDKEDGALNKENMSWTSDKDGRLGSGEEIMVYLSLGQHVITLEVKDSDDNITSTQVNINVVESHYGKLYLPLIRKQ